MYDFTRSQVRYAIGMKWLYIAIADGFFTGTVCAFLTRRFLAERISIIGDAFGLERTENPGIAFGLHLGAWQSAFILAALAAVAWIAFTQASKPLERYGYGMIIGGGLANIVDRIPDGFVTDMIQVGTFPVFNVADAYINVGIAFVIIAAMRKDAHES